MYELRLVANKIQWLIKDLRTPVVTMKDKRRLIRKLLKSQAHYLYELEAQPWNPKRDTLLARFVYKQHNGECVQSQVAILTHAGVACSKAGLTGDERAHCRPACPRKSPSTCRLSTMFCISQSAKVTLIGNLVAVRKRTDERHVEVFA